MKRDIANTHKWNIADPITSVRMVASLFLLFLPLSSARFIALYTFTGLTDALDGWLARKTGTASDFGARLDSIADLLFYGIVLVRLFPVLWQLLPAYITATVKYHRFASLHTWLNKLTGAALFLLPYVLAASTGIVYSWTVCIIALAASAEELTIHFCQKEYRADIKSIFQRERKIR